MPPIFLSRPCCLNCSSLMITEMNPHASRFDDPQCTRDRLILEDSQETLQSADDTLKCCPWPHVQHDYSSAPLRGKTSNLAEIAIKRNEHSPLGRAYLEQFFIRDAVKTLIPHGHHIMAGCLKKLQATAPR